MLRKIRITLAAVMFVCITLLFLDFTGTMHHYVSWMPKIQFLEAILALNVVAIVILVLLTVIFGRIYCSIICPLISPILPISAQTTGSSKTTPMTRLMPNSVSIYDCNVSMLATSGDT